MRAITPGLFSGEGCAVRRAMKKARFKWQRFCRKISCKVTKFRISGVVTTFCFTKPRNPVLEQPGFLYRLKKKKKKKKVGHRTRHGAAAFGRRGRTSRPPAAVPNGSRRAAKSRRRAAGARRSRSTSATKRRCRRRSNGLERVDLLVNNAGLAAGFEHLDRGSTADWDAMIDTNVKGLLYVSQIVARKMIAAGGGHIVNIGSIAGTEPYENGAVYCATKHAVHAISQSMRADLLSHGIKVSEVRPGMVETEFSVVRFHGDQRPPTTSTRASSPSRATT